jgi:hypothetical protein
MSWMDEDNYGDSGGTFYGSTDGPMDDSDPFFTNEQQTYPEPNTYGYNSTPWGASQEADDSLYNYQSFYPDQGYSDLPQQQDQGFLSNMFSGNTALPAAPAQAQGQTLAPALAPSAQGQQGGITSILSQLFGGGSKLLAGLVEGNQNKKKQAAYNNILSSPTKIASNSPFDPFNSERPFYQQQARQTVTDPYSSPIVRNQINEIQRQQNIKDAAAGRRSNMIGSAPGVMAAQAKVAQDYLTQMLNAGGSKIDPAAKEIAALQTGAANAGVNGYLSPMSSALGNMGQSYQNEDTLGQILAALQQQKAR